MVDCSLSPSVTLDDFPDRATLKGALAALQRGPIRFQRDNIIACEGDTADYIFLVLSGVVRTCKTFENGGRTVVAFYLPGGLLGWDDEKCSLSVEAASEAVVLLIKRRGLMDLARQDTLVSNFLLSATRNELRRTQEHSALLSRDAKFRVQTFLADLSSRTRNTEYVDLPMSHKDIADYLGLTIETLSRTITKLERSGAIARSSYKRLSLNHAALVRETV